MSSKKKAQKAVNVRNFKGRGIPNKKPTQAQRNEMAAFGAEWNVAARDSQDKARPYTDSPLQVEHLLHPDFKKHP